MTFSCKQKYGGPSLPIKKKNKKKIKNKKSKNQKNIIQEKTPQHGP